MITPELRQFVAQALASGQPVDDIREKLKSQGWESLDVEQALAQAGQAPVAPKPAGSFPSVFEMIAAASRHLWSRSGTMLPIAVAAAVLLSLAQWLGYGTLDPRVTMGSQQMAFPGGPLAVAGYWLLMLVYMYSWFTALVAIVRPDVSTVEGAASGALRRFFPLLGVSALSFIIIAGGTLLLVVPGFIFAVWFAFATYIYLAQGGGVVRSLRLSKEYARGFFWRIVWAYFAASILLLIASAILAAVLGGLSILAGPAGFVLHLLLNATMLAIAFLYATYGNQILLALQGRKGVLEDAPKITAPIVLGIVGWVIVVPLLIVGGIFAALKGRGALQPNLSSLGSQEEIQKVFEFAAARAAVEAYHDEEGSYPATLADLGPDYLNRQLVDVSNFTYTSTGATYRICATIGGQETCESPDDDSTPTAGAQ